MRVLVLGGTGFLGSRVVPKLVARGVEVTVVTRRASELPGLRARGVEGLVGDLVKPDSILFQLSPHDVVVFMAMPLTFGRMSRRRFLETRDRTTRFVKTALAIGSKLSCPLLLTQGTSYRTDPGVIVDERRPIDRFGIVKVAEPADDLIAAALRDGTPPLVRLLPGQIYGPGGLFLEMYRRLKSGRFGIVGKGDNHIPRIHVEDCAEAFALAVEKLPVGETYILADSTPCTTREFTEFMAECMGRPVPRTIPRFLARLMLGKLLVETMEMNCLVANAKAKRELGWTLRYPSFREGLVATVRAIETMEAAPSSDLRQSIFDT